MELTTIRELFKNREAYIDQKITVGGWVRSIRDSAEVSRLNVGAAVIVTGTLVATPQAKQPFEIQADTVEIEGASAPDYPLQKKRHSFEYLRTISHLRPRTNTFQAVFRVRSLDPPVLPGEGIRVCAHAADHGKRLRGRGRDVPRDHAGYGKCAEE